MKFTSVRRTARAASTASCATIKRRPCITCVMFDDATCVRRGARRSSCQAHCPVGRDLSHAMFTSRVHFPRGRMGLPVSQKMSTGSS